MPKWFTSMGSVQKKKLHFLLNSWYWPIEELKEYQWKKFEQLLNHAYEYVPYYKELLKNSDIKPKDIQDFNDLKKIPILSRKNLQNDLKSLLSSEFNPAKLQLNSTGGSTGMPVKIYQDRNYLEWSAAATIRAWKYMPGFDEHEIEAVLWGAFRDIEEGLTFRNIVNFIIKPDIRINTFNMDEKKIKRFIFLFNKFKPRLVKGYASSLYFVAEYIEKNNINIHYPQSIVSSSETLFPKMREKISKVFNAKIFDSYGCREVSHIATECENNCGMHIVMENQIVELEKDNYRRNRIIVTNLNNFCMPIIRYEVEDLATYFKKDKCTCGRTQLRIEKVLGRVNENIMLKNSKIISGIYFEFLFYEIRSIERFQVSYSLKNDKMVIRIKSKSRDEEIVKFFKETIGKHFGFYNIEVYFTDKFQKTKTGKFKFVWMENE